MLSENIKRLRRSKGLSQEELALKINVVRQTISKWENGTSVPDAQMLITLSKALDTSVDVLLGEDVIDKDADDLKAISQKLEVINHQLASNKESKRKTIRLLCLIGCMIVVIGLLVVYLLGSPYQNWDMSDHETAVLATIWHSFEWAFVRIAPFIIILFVIGIILTKRIDN